jgi:hypothetical protein
MVETLNVSPHGLGAPATCGLCMHGLAMFKRAQAGNREAHQCSLRIDVDSGRGVCSALEHLDHEAGCCRVTVAPRGKDRELQKAMINHCQAASLNDGNRAV